MCLNINLEYRLLMGLLNNELKSNLEGIFIARAKSKILKYIVTSTDRDFKAVGLKWLNLMEVLDQEQLWSCDVTAELFLCMIRLLKWIDELKKPRTQGFIDLTGNKFKKMKPFFMTLDLASNFGNTSLIEIVTRVQKTTPVQFPIIMENLDLAIKNKFTNVVNVSIKCVDLKKDIENKDCRQCDCIKVAVECGDLDLLKSLFQLLIKAHSKIMESIYLPISLDKVVMIRALNHPCPEQFDLEGIRLYAMTPLHMAAKNGNIEMIRLFVENIKYIDYVNTKYNDGLSPIEAAAFNHHFEIVNMLMPLTTDVEYQTIVDDSCTKLL